MTGGYATRKYNTLRYFSNKKRASFIEALFFMLSNKNQRFCHAERSEAFQCESQSEPEKQLESKFFARFTPLGVKY
jgi:hypothetical protein